MILMVIGTLMVLASLGTFEVPSLIIGGLMALFGYRGYKKGQKRLGQRQRQQQFVSQASRSFKLDEKTIRRLAERLGGKLSAEDLSKQTSLSFDQAKEKLESMHTKGLIEIDLDGIGDDGQIYYKF